jgi:hypothetical protein
MPRTIIDLPPEQIEALDRLRAQRHMTRASLVREALATYLSSHHAGLADEAFGIWKKRKMRALSYEDKLRSEWPS